MRTSPLRFVAISSVTAIAALLLGAASVGAAPVRASASTGGLNDLRCRPTNAHPQPVLLLHGLGGDPNSNWAMFGPALARAGYCTFTSPYGAPSGLPFYGLQPVDKSAHEIAHQVDQILAATGATQVDLVGHSEGGFLSLYVPKVLAYGSKVHAVVAMAPPSHGTSFFSLVTLGQRIGMMGAATMFLQHGGCGACADLIVGGAAVQRLDAGPIAVPGVAYTVIATRFDELVRADQFSPPTDTAFVREAGVHNAYVQDTCPFDPVGHVGLAFDSGVLTMVENALDPVHALPVRCSFGLPV